MPNEKLLALDTHISKEIYALSDKFATFPETDLDRERFLDFSRHLDYTESLILEALPLIDSVNPDPEDKAFYSVLEAKNSLNKNYDDFHRLRNAFLARYVKKERSLDNEIDRERAFIPEDSFLPEEEPALEPSSDELTEEELAALEEEEMLAQLEAELAEQEEADAKAAKQKKERERQRKFTAEGHAQDQENAAREAKRQENRRAEAERMGMRVSDGQQISDAQLHHERVRQEEARNSQAQILAERKRLGNETFEEYKARMERSDTYPRAVLYSHNDFNAFGGDPNRNTGGYESYSHYEDRIDLRPHNPAQPYRGSDPYSTAQEKAPEKPAENYSYDTSIKDTFSHNSKAYAVHPDNPSYQPERPEYTSDTRPKDSRPNYQPAINPVEPSKAVIPLHRLPHRPDEQPSHQAATSYQSRTPDAHNEPTSAREETPYRSELHSRPPEQTEHTQNTTHPTNRNTEERHIPSSEGTRNAPPNDSEHGRLPQSSMPYAYTPKQTPKTSSSETKRFEYPEELPSSTVFGRNEPPSQVSSYRRPADTRRHEPEHIKRPDIYTPKTGPLDPAYGKPGDPYKQPERPITQSQRSDNRPQMPHHTVVQNPYPSSAQRNVLQHSMPSASKAESKGPSIQSSQAKHRSEGPYMPQQHPAPRIPEKSGYFSDLVAPTPQGMVPLTKTMPSALGMRSQVIASAVAAGGFAAANHIPGSPKDIRPKRVLDVPQTNRSLYLAVSMGSPVDSKTPVHVSPAVEQQMIMNLQNVRMKYHKASTEDARLAISKEYKQERNALMQLRKDIKNGRFTVTPEEVLCPVPSVPKRGAIRTTDQIYSRPTPTGFTGKGYAHDMKSSTLNTRHVLHEHVKREEKRFTPQNPMRVTPAYDQAIASRYSNAKKALDQFTRKNINNPGFVIPHTLEHELSEASEALLGYNRAKVKGTVIIDPNAQRNVPDYKAWQQRQRAADINFNLGSVFGTTGYSRSQNLNRPQKSTVSEISASLLNSKSLLKRESLKKAYVKSWGYRAENYTRMAARRLSHKAVSALSGGNESSSETVRFMDNGVYYGGTTARIVYSLLLDKSVPGADLAKQMAKKEFKLFGPLASLKDSELTALVEKGTENAALAQKLLAFRSDNKHAIAQGVKLGQMTQGKSLSEKINILEKELKRIDKVHYKKLHKSFSAEGMQKALDRAADDLSKKFGRKVHLKTKGVDLSTMTAKSIDAEINRLKMQGSSISKQLKQLYAKGSALTASERKLVTNLLQQHKENNVQLSRLIGFKKENINFKPKRDVTSKAFQGALRRQEYLKSGAYMLQGLALRPLQQSDLAGVNGLAKMANLSTNRYVIAITKNSLKSSYQASMWASKKLGLDRAARAAGKATKTAATAAKTSINNTAVVKTVRPVIHSQVGKAGSAVRSIQRAAVNAQPQKVKTAIKGAKAFNSAMKTRFDTVATGIKNAVFRAKNWAAGTRVGRGVSALNRGLHSVGKGIRLVAGAAKTFLLKAGIALILILVVMCLIGGALSSITSVVSSVIASPDTKDNKIDLSKYYNYLVEVENDFYNDLESQGEKYDDYRVNISNGGMENTREILSMMAVYLEQNLDIEKNRNVKIYLKSLFEDSHTVTKTTEKYKCDGCETRRVEGDHDGSCPEDCTKKHYEYEEYCPSHTRAIFTVTILGFDEIFSADSMGNSGYDAVAGGLIGKFKITYYCIEPYAHICNDGSADTTASGTKPTPGRTIAVDPDVIPLGSHVIIDGHEYIAEDTGGAINGNRIDIVVETHAEALEKGTRTNVDVYTPNYEGDGKQDSGRWNGWVEENIEWCKHIYNMPWAEIYTGIPNVTDIVGNQTDLSGVEFIDGDRPGYDPIVNIALSQQGNIGGQPYWSWYGFDSRVAWCAAFVSWCANEAGVLNEAIPKFASCSVQGAPWFKEQGQWAKGGSITPVAGDVIFFDWEQDGRTDHVGYVVGTDGKNVYTIEGNSNDAVRTKSYSLNSAVIYGYGLPNY